MTLSVEALSVLPPSLCSSYASAPRPHSTEKEMKAQRKPVTHPEPYSWCAFRIPLYSAQLSAWETAWVGRAVKISLVLHLGFPPVFGQAHSPALGAARGNGNSVLDVCGGEEARGERESFCVRAFLLAVRRMRVRGRHRPSCSMNGALALTLQNFLKLLIGLAV